MMPNRFTISLIVQALISIGLLLILIPQITFMPELFINVLAPYESIGAIAITIVVPLAMWNLFRKK